MLKFITPTGSIEATADDERRVRGLSDLALCRQLNAGRNVDLFMVAELRERPHIQPSPFGWLPNNVQMASAR